MTLVTQTAQVRQILTEHRVIAVVGFHHQLPATRTDRRARGLHQNRCHTPV